LRARRAQGGDGDAAQPQQQQQQAQHGAAGAARRFPARSDLAAAADGRGALLPADLSQAEVLQRVYAQRLRDFSEQSGARGASACRADGAALTRDARRLLCGARRAAAWRAARLVASRARARQG
jgi:hypothetical protein